MAALSQHITIISPAQPIIAIPEELDQAFVPEHL